MKSWTEDLKTIDKIVLWLQEASQERRTKGLSSWFYPDRIATEVGSTESYVREVLNREAAGPVPRVVSTIRSGIDRRLPIGYRLTDYGRSWTL